MCFISQDPDVPGAETFPRALCANRTERAERTERTDRADCADRAVRSARPARPTHRAWTGRADWATRPGWAARLAPPTRSAPARERRIVSPRFVACTHQIPQEIYWSEGAEPARGMRISCVRAGAGWECLSSVCNAGKVPKRAPK